MPRTGTTSEERAQRVEGRSPSMIRFLQKENRLTKALFVVIIARCLRFDGGLPDPRAHRPERVRAPTRSPSSIRIGIAAIFSGATSSPSRRSRSLPRQRVQQQYPQYAGNPMIMNMIEPQVGQQLVQQQILLDEARNWASTLPMPTCATICRPDLRARCCFPTGNSSGRTSTPR